MQSMLKSFSLDCCSCILDPDKWHKMDGGRIKVNILVWRISEKISEDYLKFLKKKFIFLKIFS